VAYLTGEIAELRKRVPTRQPQAAAPIVRTTHATDPLERLFAAIAPTIDASGMMDGGVYRPAVPRPDGPDARASALPS
jgi:hypothetical protein